MASSERPKHLHFQSAQFRALQGDAATARFHQIARDPATGVKHRYSSYQPFWVNAEIDYDMPEENLRLGVTFHDDARQFDYRIDEISSNYHGIKLGAFIEYKPTPDWTLRLFGEDLAQSVFFRDRGIYPGLRGAVPLAQVEHRALNNGALIGIHVQRDF